MSKDEITAQMAEQWAVDEYKRNREQEYPDLKDQLDKIFHEGIDAWKEEIQAIKDRHPKP